LPPLNEIDEAVDEGEHLKQLRKMLQTKEYDVVNRRRNWQRQVRKPKPSHSPVFMKRPKGGASATDMKLNRQNSRMYDSNPVLNSLPKFSMKSLYRSMPGRLNLISNQISDKFTKLPKLQPHNVMFSDELLGGEADQTVEERPERNEAADNEGDEIVDDGVTNDSLSTTGTTALKADWLFEESLKEEMKRFERQMKRLMISTGLFGFA
jgi:hypothetical protein